MSSLKSYIVRETAIGAAINLAISTAFFFGLFGGQAEPLVWGAKGLIVDCVPQGFMIGLMSIIPAMLITSKRAKAGLHFDLPSRHSVLPRNVFVRGLTVAVLSMITLVAAAAGLAFITGAQSVPFWLAFGLKCLPALVIPAVVIPPALVVALGKTTAGQPLVLEGGS
ncbi:MAG: hypothetical protein ACK4NU_02265 [Brevundimonas sp.]